MTKEESILNPKIPKIRENLETNRKKIAALQAQNREMEKKLRELENLDIVGLVRAQGLSLEEFAEMLQSASRSPIPPKEEAGLEDDC